MRILFRSPRKFLAQCLAALMVLSQTSQAVAATDISDVPMAVKNSVIPNVMFTLDDSGSMQWEVMPEDQISQSIYYVFPENQHYYGSGFYDDGGTARVGGFEDGNVHNFMRRSSYNNKMYYDPDIDYKPWSKSDGSLWPNADITCAYHNPADTARGCRNLTVLNDGDANTSTDSYGKWRRRDAGGNYAWFTGKYVNAVTNTAGFWPATYFVFKPSNVGCDGNATTPACYTKVEIRSTTPTYTSPSGKVRTYAQEIQNFANWYSYYRSRVLAARAGVGRAFAQQGSGMRVGFGAINKGTTTIDGVSTGTVVRGVRAFSGADRDAFFTELYGHTIPEQGTPLRRALDDVGRYFKRTDDKGPWGENPGAGGGTQFACRQNYHILMTDGYWNGSGASTGDAQQNVDNTAGPNITGPDNQSYTYTPGNPYSDQYSDTLADVAMYYWVNDLRADLDNKVPTNGKDPAFWQHMVNFTVGLGVFGTISKTAIDSAFTSSPQTITWPDPTSSDAAKIDDLAHAAVNSRGGFFSASDPDAFAKALSDALNDIVSRNGAAAAVAVANANVTSGDNASYSSSYNSGTWTGNLNAFPIDLNTGQPIETTPLWTAGSAQAQLDARTPSSRFIVTHTGDGGNGQGIQFQPTTASTPTKLSSTQQNLLNTPVSPPGPSDGAAVVAYLRGDKSGEGTSYRTRAHLLGDIINAEPVIVREPMLNYGDNGYTTYKTAKASRTKIVYQGANDGMLHAFNASTGAEVWAYIPSFLHGTLNNLSRKNGFAHLFYVDGTPVSGDVDFKNTDGATGGGTDWRTILVGGLGKGGRGYYALDVTDPIPSDEAAAAAKVLWEFPNASTASADKKNVGYTFGKPIIVKTKAKGWVVLVTSGYNNGSDTGGDGQGRLFVLNARTGELITSISTGVGTSADPSGLAQISAYVENGDVDAEVQYVYGGDLKGNVWRFDLSSNNSNQWNVKKLATLVDASGVSQPITTAPELAKIDDGGTFRRLVYVGTGQYLGSSDVPGTAGANIHASQTQTMYGLVDDQSSSPTIFPLRTNLQQQTFTSFSAGGTGTVSSNTVDYSTKRGWYLDLPLGGARISTDPALALGTLATAVNVPNSDPCAPGGTSYALFLDYKTGGFVTDGGLNYSMSFLGNALSSRPVLVKLPDGKVVAIFRKSNATTETSRVPTKSGGTALKRVSWRELPDE